MVLEGLYRSLCDVPSVQVCWYQLKRFIILLHLWCHISPQAIVTLNLLWPSRINPTLSAHAQLHGLFDFNATTFAPPVTEVIVNLKPTIRKSWAPRGQDGWYIDRAKDQERCYNIYIPETIAVIQPDTIEFLPQNCKMPFRSSA